MLWVGLGMQFLPVKNSLLLVSGKAIHTHPVACQAAWLRGKKQHMDTASYCRWFRESRLLQIVQSTVTITPGQSHFSGLRRLLLKAEFDCGQPRCCDVFKILRPQTHCMVVQDDGASW